MVDRAAAPTPPPSPPRKALPTSSRGSYMLLGSDKYKSTEVEGEFARTSEIAAVVNAAAMELGALVCTARSPKCEVCPLAKLR